MQHCAVQKGKSLNMFSPDWCKKI